MTRTKLQNTTTSITGRPKIRVTKLHGFDGGVATYRDRGTGLEYDAVNLNGVWYLTGDYTYTS